MKKKFLAAINGTSQSVRRYGVGLGLLATAGAASAQSAIDVSSVTTAITAAGVAVATIGAAVLVVIYGAKAYKWVRSAG